MGPEGTGALVVADPDALRVGRPSYLSQDGYEQDGAFEPKEGAARFDPNLTPGAPSRAAGGDRARSRLGARAGSRDGGALPRRGSTESGEDVVVPEEPRHARLLARSGGGVRGDRRAAGGRRE